MVTKQIIENLTRIGKELEHETLELMDNGTIVYDKLVSHAGPFTIISANGDYRWDFSKTEEGEKLLKKWRLWLDQIGSLLKEHRDATLFKSYSSISQRVLGEWREHKQDKIVIEDYRLFFTRVYDYFDNISQYASSEISGLSISTEQLNMTIDAQQATIILNGLDDLLLEIKKLIDKGELSVTNDRFSQLLDEAIKSKGDRSKTKKVFDSIRSDVVIVNPLLQMLSSVATVVSALIH